MGFKSFGDWLIDTGWVGSEQKGKAKLLRQLSGQWCRSPRKNMGGWTGKSQPWGFKGCGPKQEVWKLKVQIQPLGWSIWIMPLPTWSCIWRPWPISFSAALWAMKGKLTEQSESLAGSSAKQGDQGSPGSSAANYFCDLEQITCLP